MEKPSLGGNVLHSQRIQRQVAASKAKPEQQSQKHEQSTRPQQKIEEPKVKMPAKLPLLGQPKVQSPNLLLSTSNIPTRTQKQSVLTASNVPVKATRTATVESSTQPSSPPPFKLTSLQMPRIQEASPEKATASPQLKHKKKDRRVSWKLIPEIRQIPRRVGRRSRRNMLNLGTRNSHDIPEVEAHLLENTEEAGIENFEVSAVHSLQLWRKSQTPTSSSQHGESFDRQALAFSQGTPQPTDVALAGDQSIELDAKDQESSSSSSHDGGKSFFDRIANFWSGQAFEKSPGYMSDICNGATETLSNHLKQQEHCLDFELEVETPELPDFYSSTSETIAPALSDDDTCVANHLESSSDAVDGHSSVFRATAATADSQYGSDVKQHTYSHHLFMSEIYGKATEALAMPFQKQPLLTNHSPPEQCESSKFPCAQKPNDTDAVSLGSRGKESCKNSAVNDSALLSNTNDQTMPESESHEVAEGIGGQQSRVNGTSINCGKLDSERSANRGSKQWGFLSRRKQKETASETSTLSTDKARRSRSLFTKRKKTNSESQSLLLGTKAFQDTPVCSSIDPVQAAPESANDSNACVDEESSTKLDFQQDPKDVSSTSGKRVEDDMHTFANLFVNAWEYTPFSFPWNDEEMKAMHNSEEVRFEEESLSECSNSHDQRRKTEAGQILDGSLVPNKRKGIHGPGEACEKQRVGDVIVGPSRGAQLVVSIHQNQEVQKELLNVPNEKEGKTDASVSVSGTSQHRKQGIDLTTRLDEYDHPLDEFDSPNPIRAFTTEESMASQPTYDLCDTDQPSDEEDVDRAAQSQMTQSTLPQTSSYSLGRKAQPLTPSKNSAFQSNQKMIVKESIGCGSSEQEAGLNQNTMFGLRKRSKNNKHPYDHLEISFSGESYESQRWKDGNFNKYYVESIDSDSYTNSLVSTTDASASLEFETEEETIDTDEFETEDEESRADGNDTEAEGDVTEGFQTDDEREEINDGFVLIQSGAKKASRALGDLTVEFAKDGKRT